ncbi:MAG: biotin transporter BioY [Chlamydiota bacterium]
MLNSQVVSGTAQTRTRTQAWARDAALVLGASILIAVSAQIKIALPFTPVPVSMQSFAVLFFAALLGSKRGALAVLAYLAEGALGLPVFSGAHSGLLYMAGATGGYLVGFVMAAYVTGLIIEKSKKTFKNALVALLAGDAIIYACGIIWLMQFVGGMKAAFVCGMLPFLIGNAVKTLLALSGIKAARAFKI